MARHEDSDEDTYATMGTPFEVLETEEDVQKAKERKEKEQYVTDSQGRRRFHGAFTGGFSAGYYNTVGSKEGWAPSTFHSSREKKSQYVGQKPEDFMDEEDLGAGGIAPREITTSSQFSQKGAGLKRPHPLDNSRPSVIPGEAPLQNLVVPAKSSIGARLLQSMGWKEGQGVGPKIQRYSTPAPKIYGCSLPHQSAALSGSEETAPVEAYGFWFAPHDIRPWEFEGRDDLHGIGYSGMEEREVLGRRETTRALYGMKGEAFGIGALEEEDTEDNVYGEESIASYHATLAGEGDLDMERKFGWTGGSEDFWSLASFTKATKPHPRSKVYPSPDVPRDFVPIHRFSILNIKATDGPEQHGKPVSVAERSQLLADTPGSVFSLLSPEDRDRLKRATEVAQQPSPASNTQHLPPKTHQHPPTAADTRPHPLATPTFVPTTAPPTELSLPAQQQSTLNSVPVEDIKPFVHDPAKQARYEAFLGGRRLHADPVSVGMTEWERQREREEFSRTARIYQPLSVSLSSRFTRAEETEKSKKSESPEPDSVQAARANLFGVLTREIVEWHPHRVLCKRFNVPDPYPNSGVVGVASSREQNPKQVKNIQFLTTEKMGADSTKDSRKEGGSGYPKEDTEGTSLQGVKMDTLPSSEEPVKDDREGTIKDSPSDAKEKEGEDTEEEQADAVRPPMDLFKAIFAESSAESDISSDAEMETETPHKNVSSSLGNQETAASTQTSSTTQESVRKTRWQDLSEVTTKLLPINTTTTSLAVGGGALAGRQATVPAASSVIQMEERTQRNALQNGGKVVEKGAAATESKGPEVFGPILPPEFDPDSITHSGSNKCDRRTVDDFGGGGGKRKKEDTKHSKHKHKHHRAPKKKKADRTEGHSHKRKEKRTRHKQ